MCCVIAATSKTNKPNKQRLFDKLVFVFGPWVEKKETRMMSKRIC